MGHSGLRVTPDQGVTRNCRDRILNIHPQEKCTSRAHSSRSAAATAAIFHMRIVRIPRRVFVL